MKNTLQYHVRRAHTQMRGTYQYIGQKKGVTTFLKKVKNHYNYDVMVFAWNGTDGEMSWAATGDDFLKRKAQFEHLKSKQL